MKTVLISIKVFLALTFVTCIFYPLMITAIAQFVITNEANGSMIVKNNNVIGSELIGQQFIKPEFFWGRPSAINYNPIPSGGSNLNPVGENLKSQIQARIDTIRKYHGNLNIEQIPEDLLFSSASGVDPHISPEAAYFQVNRIAKFRNFDDSKIKMLTKLIDTSIEKPDFLIFGLYRVNVLKLNLKLMEL